MIDLAMCMTLQNEGFGTYGKTLFFGTSPVLDTGSVTNAEGIWVNANTVGINGDLYTDQLTISSRYFRRDRTRPSDAPTPALRQQSTT